MSTALIKVCKLSHAIATKSVGLGYVAVAFTAMSDGTKLVESNRNLPTNFDTEPMDWKSKLGTPDFNSQGVNSLGFGFEGESLPYSASAIGGIACQFKTGKGRAGYVPAVKADFELIQGLYPRECSVHFIFDGLFNGESDRKGIKGEGVGLGVEAFRSNIRSAVMDGFNYSQDGNVVNSFIPVNDVLSQDGPFGNRHFFVAVCRVTGKDDFKKGPSRQIRLYADQINIYWVNPNEFDSVFPSDRMFGFELSELIGESTVSVIPAATVPPQVCNSVLAVSPIYKENAKATSSKVSEIAAYYKAVIQDVFTKKTVKRVSVEEVIQSVNIGHQSIGTLAGQYIAQYLIQCGANLTTVELNDWTLDDVKNIISLINHALSLKNKGTKTLEIYETETGIKLGFDTRSFVWSFDGTFWYDHRGRALMNSVVISTEKKDKTETVKRIDVISSMQNLVKALWLGYCPILASAQKGFSDKGCGASFINFVDKAHSLISFSLDEVLGESGGFVHALECQFIPKMCNTKLVFKNGTFPKLSAERDLLSYYGCKVVNSGDQKEDEYIITVPIEILIESIPLAIAKGMEMIFHKGTFLRGDLSHIDLEILSKSSPALYSEIESKYGFNKDTVISLTSKAAKGAKRMMLGLAKSISPYAPSENGWKFYSQRVTGSGTAVKMAFMPSIVGPAGEIVWMGKDEERPVGILKKSFKATFKLNDSSVATEELITLEGSRLEGYGYTFKSHGEWNYFLASDEACIISPEDTIAFCQGMPIVFDELMSGVLIGLKWMVTTNMSGDREIQVIYRIESEESWMKARSVMLKGMMISGPSNFLMESNFSPALGVDCVGLQDSIKSDTIYGWLSIIGNTVYHNPGCAELNSMRAEIQKINSELGSDSDQLIIDPVSVVLGRYDQLMAEFKEMFTRPMWVRWSPAGSLGAMMYELYTNKVASNVEGWHQIESPNATKFDSLISYSDGEDNTANVLIFCLKNNEIVEYWQRGLGLAGTAECPLYDVLCFESSSVSESVTRSNQLPSYVRSLVRAQPELMSEGKSMLSEGEGKGYKASLLAAFKSGSDFGGEDAGMSILTLEDGEVIKTILEENEILEFDLLDKSLFERVCVALKDVVLKVGDMSLWAPGLFSFNSLRSSNDGSLNISGIFLYEILIPMIEGKLIPSLVVNKLRGKINSLCSSRNTAKLMSGRDSLQAKRVSLPTIPSGETWILRSEIVNSCWQQLDRNLRTRLEWGQVVPVQGIRAPMADGMVTNLRMVTLGDFAKTGWSFGPHEIGISPSDMYWDGGDCDGDGHYPIEIKDLKAKINTYSELMKFRNGVLGSNMLGAKSESYAGDHLGIKSSKSAFGTLDGLSGLIKNKASLSRKDYTSINKDARSLQTKGVGTSYEIFALAEQLIDIVSAAAKVGEDVGRFCNLIGMADVISNLGEIYEVILGGYSKSSLNAFNQYLSKVKSGGLNTRDINCFAKAIKDMGINSAKASIMAECFHYVSAIKQMESSGCVDSDLFDPRDSFILSAAMCSFELERGRFVGFTSNFKSSDSRKATCHRQALELVVEEICEIDPSWVEESLVLWNLMNVLKASPNILISGYGSEITEEATNYFLSKLKGLDKNDDQDEDDTDGGIDLNPVVPVAPSNNGINFDVDVDVDSIDLNPVAPVQLDMFQEAELLTANSIYRQGPTAAPDWITLESPSIGDSNVEILEVTEPKKVHVNISIKRDYAVPLGLNEEQAIAFQDAMAGHQCFLTGEGGSGKSFLTNQLRAAFQTLNYKVVVLGSTGVSVMNVEGDGTFNSRLGLGLGFVQSEQGRMTKGEEYNLLVQKSVSDSSVRYTFSKQKYKGVVVFIDEVSMLDTSLINVGYDIIKQINPDAYVHLVGDLAQLLPVRGELISEDAEINFVKESKIVESILTRGSFKVQNLKKNERVQGGDSEFISELNTMRLGGGIGPVIKSRFDASQHGTPENALHIFFNNEDIKRFNDSRVNALIEQGKPFKVYRAKVKVFSGTRENLLKTMDPIAEEMTLCIGCPVMIRKNLTDQGSLLAANGSCGIIIELGNDWVRVELENGDKIKVSVQELHVPSDKKGLPVGKFEQLPLHPAMACSMYKVQGLTIDKPIVVHAWHRSRGGKKSSISANVGKGALYVACSRVTSRDLLYFDTEDSLSINWLYGSCHTEPKAIKFYK